MSNDQINRLENKIDKLDERLDGIDKILVLQEANLKAHMRRSDALEALIHPVKEDVAKYKDRLRFLGLLFGGISFVAGLVLTIIQIINA